MTLRALLLVLARRAEKHGEDAQAASYRAALESLLDGRAQCGVRDEQME